MGSGFGGYGSKAPPKVRGACPPPRTPREDPAPEVELLNIRRDWETEHIDVLGVSQLESAAANVVAVPVFCPCPFLSGLQNFRASELLALDRRTGDAPCERVQEIGGQQKGEACWSSSWGHERREHLLNPYCMLRRASICLHFTEESEAQRGEVTSLWPHNSATKTELETWSL